MIDFTAYRSSSLANLYTAAVKGAPLLLEAGLPAQSIRCQLGFNLTDIAACLVTHEHQDHIQGAAGVMRSGVDVYCTEGTARAAGLSGHRLHIVKPFEQFRIGPWRIMPFPSIHNAEEPVGYLLGAQDELLLFAVDTGYLKYRFPGLTHLAIECNWEADLLRENVYSGGIPPNVASSIRRRHMSLDRVEDMLRANDLSSLEEIHLLHLSRGNGREEEARRRIEGIAGVPAYVAPE